MNLRLGLGLSERASGPALGLNFLSGTLDPRITFTRGTTATRVNASGLLETVGTTTPRFDYDPVTLAPKGLLIEEQRTNLALRSEEFDAATWQKQAGVSVTGVNVGVSPSGTTTADEVTFTATTNDSIYQSITVLATTAYTFSIWVKGAGGQVLQVSCQPPAAAAVFTSVTLNGQWQRVSATATTTGAGAMNVAVDLVSGTTPAIVQLWGGQIEAGAYATSYIPTVASTVTRSADVATMTGTNFSSWYNQSEGTFVANYSATVDPAGTYRSQLKARNAGDTNNIQIRNANLAPTTAVTNNQVVNTTAQADFTSATLVGGAAVKTSLAYKTNDFASVTNAAAPITDISGTVPSDLTNIVFGGGAFACGQTWFSSIAYYNTRLPNATLVALTA